MANQAQILKIVVASPGDVQAERDILPNVVDELNRSTAADRSLRLELNRWETDAFPAFHLDGPQGLIDGILRIDDCDVLIAIFWKRFGTPVRDADSGTEHEFYLAYEAWKKNGRPQIMLYFRKESHAPQTADELDQWGRVLRFQQTIPTEALWWSYETTAEFERLVRNHLIQFLRKFVPKSFELSNDLNIHILGTEAPDYSQSITLDFCIINDSPKHATLTGFSVEILRADPLPECSITSPGAPFSPTKYFVRLEPTRARIPITNQRFMYGPNERDDFQLELSSEPGFEYEIRISAQHRDILRNQTRQVISETVVLGFPLTMER